jgi:hypothetical protein
MKNMLKGVNCQSHNKAIHRRFASDAMLVILPRLQNMSIEKIDTMISILKEVKRNEIKMNRLRQIRSGEVAPKRFSNAQADLNEIAMANIKLSHQLHALSVELGFAEMRENYNQVILTDGWRKFEYRPPVPFFNNETGSKL